MIEAAVVTFLIERSGDGVGGNGTQWDGEGEFLIGEVRDRDAGTLAQAFVGKETKVLVFADGAADGAAVLLAAVVGLWLSACSLMALLVCRAWVRKKP